MTTTITPEQVRDLYQECGGDLIKVAEKLGIPYSEFASKFGADLAPPATPPARRRPPPADLGHREGAPNPKYIVAVRHANNNLWPADKQSAIDQARRDYEAGTHTICQGRDRDWFIMYSIPLRKRVGARKFFQTY